MQDMQNNPIKKEAAETTSEVIVSEEKNIVKQDYDIQGFIEKRQQFITKVNAICIEGKDYHVIQGKKSLAKGGAEKIASIFHWTAKFDKDTESLEMLGSVPGLVAFKCTLENGHFVGEGRGAAVLSKNNGDPNRTLKMAQKSAFIDAVLRASGLSDFFTQDLEDIPQDQIKEWKPTAGSHNATQYPISDKQKDYIKSLLKSTGTSAKQIEDKFGGKITGWHQAKEVITWLLSLKSKQEDLPIIQQEEAIDIEDAYQHIPY